MSLIDDIVRLSGPLPNEARFRNWLEGQKMAALEARLQQLETENEKPDDYRRAAPALVGRSARYQKTAPLPAVAPHFPGAHGGRLRAHATAGLAGRAEPRATPRNCAPVAT